MQKENLLPKGMSLAKFGTVIGWGTKDKEAIQRAGDPSLLRDLLQSQITSSMLRGWRVFYTQILLRWPKNPSAKGRIYLLTTAIDLLEMH